MSNIVPFNFESKEIRVFENNGEVVVVAKDLAEAIGYTWNGSARIQHVPEEWRGVTSVVTPSGEQEMATLTEQGVYFFLARSDKPKALPFQKWLAGDVLPTIRKTGVYVAPTPAGINLKEVPVVAKAFRALASMAKVLGLSPNQAALSAAQSLRANYKVDVIELLALPGLESPSQERHMSPTEIGKPLGVSARAINIALVEAGLQFKGEDGNWRPTEKGRPYAVYVDTTKKHHNGTPIQQLRWLESVSGLLDIEPRAPLELVTGK